MLVRLLRGALVLGLLVVGAAVAFDFLAPERSARLLFGLDRQRSGLVPKRIRVAELDVAYLEGGTGEALVLVHGFGADKDNFVRVARFLVPRYRVVIPDLPGFGESSRPDGVSYAPDVQAERLRRFVQAVVGARPVHLGGNSMGGFIVTEYALAHPDEVASLWLLAPAGTAAAFDTPLGREIANGDNPLLARTPEEFSRTMGIVMAEVPFMPHSIRHVLGARAVQDYPLHRRIFDEVGPPRVSTVDVRIRGLATPTLVVWGTKDRALNPAAAAVYDATMPNAEVVLMDGIGHLPMLEAPEAAARDYLAFRDRLAGAR